MIADTELAAISLRSHEGVMSFADLDCSCIQHPWPYKRYGERGIRQDCSSNDEGVTYCESHNASHNNIILPGILTNDSRSGTDIVHVSDLPPTI